MMGIFAAEADLYRYHKVTLQFREKLLGGIPKNPDVMEGWIRSNAGITSGTEEMRQALLRTMAESGQEVTPEMTFEEIAAASEELSAERQTNGFKFDPEHGLYIEGRQVKAALKENVNIHYAGTLWGRGAGYRGKGPKSYTAERVFVLEDRIYLGRKQPDGVDLVIGHVTGASGPRSTLSYHEFVERPTLTFHVMEAKVIREKADDDGALPPSLDRTQWAIVWTSAEENGIGALRSQGHGRFDVMEWEDVPREESPQMGADAVQAMDELAERDDEAAALAEVAAGD